MLRSAFLLLRIVLSIAAGASPAQAAGDAQRGKTLFGRCSVCHTPTAQNRIGPGLAGVAGRKAGTVQNFRYSNAMAASAITWNDPTLDNFLAAPSKIVPGTSMPVGLPNAMDRADMIAYVKTLAAPLNDLTTPKHLK